MWHTNPSEYKQCAPIGMDTRKQLKQKSVNVLASRILITLTDRDGENVQRTHTTAHAYSLIRKRTRTDRQEKKSINKHRIANSNGIHRSMKIEK